MPKAHRPSPNAQRQRPNAHHAFTLIELLVVIAIMAILMAATMPMIPAVNDQARVATCESRLQQLGVALRLYAEDYHAYPARLEQLYDGRYVEQRSVLRCEKAGEYYYRPAALDTPRETVIAACCEPATPAGRRPHRHRTAMVELHAHGGTTLNR